MRVPLQSPPRMLLLAAVVTGILVGTSSIARAELSSRQALANRQKVQAELAAAMADDTLSSAEMQSILELGEESLTPQDLAGLHRTLARLDASYGEAAEQPVEYEADSHDAVSAKNAAPIGASVPDESDSADEVSFAEPAMPADEPMPDVTDGPANEPTPAGKPTPADGSPFQEEQPLHEGYLSDSCETMEDSSVFFPEGYGLLEGLKSWPVEGWQLISLATSIDAFKGPLDLDNQNGNFGAQFAINAGFPLARRLGIGVQAGTSAVLSDFHGTQFTDDKIRSQNFTTVGLYQRVPLGQQRLSWGFAYDWLYDEYYSTMTFTQWRVQLAFELTPCHEIGIWANIPDDGDAVLLSQGTAAPLLEQFRPVAQGNFFYRHAWENGTITRAYVGIAEEPGEFIFGGDARVPISCRLAFVGNFNYILPSASGGTGAEEEMWNVSVGMEFTFGGNTTGFANKFAPMFPLANNGTFAIRRF